MDPITLAILTGMGGQALSQAGTLIPSSLEREQKKELEKLKRMQEAGALGLTDKEQAAIVGRLSGAANVSMQQAQDERTRLLAGGGAGGARALEAAVAQDAARAAQQERISQSVLEADLAREEAQKERMRALEAAAAEQRAARIGAVTSIAGAGLEAGLTTAAQQKVIQGARAPSPQLIATTKSTFGFQTDDEARGYIELVNSDPQAARLLLEIQKEKIRAGGIPMSPAAAPVAAPASAAGGTK